MGPLLAARAQEYSQQVTAHMAEGGDHAAPVPPPILAFGAMITASHNPATDNGLKLVEPSGHMLAVRWETRATELARTHLADGSDFLRTAAATLQEVAARLDPTATQHQQQHQAAKFRPFVVLIGQDTRPSGPEVADALAQSVRAFGGLPVLCGMMTTPMLHYIVMRAQQAVAVLAETTSAPGGPAATSLLHTAPAFRVERWTEFIEGALEAARRQLQLALVPAPNQLLELVVQAPRAPPVEQYFEEIADCFVVATVAAAKQRAAGGAPGEGPQTRNILVDCANGAGALSFQKLQAALDARTKEAAARGAPLPLQLNFELINKAIEDENALNDHCGADFVQKTPSLLPIYTTVAQIHRHSASPVPLGGHLPPKHLHGIAYSVDGDADRDRGADDDAHGAAQRQGRGGALAAAAGRRPLHSALCHRGAARPQGRPRGGQPRHRRRGRVDACGCGADGLRQRRRHRLPALAAGAARRVRADGGQARARAGRGVRHRHLLRVQRPRHRAGAAARAARAGQGVPHHHGARVDPVAVLRRRRGEPDRGRVRAFRARLVG